MCTYSLRERSTHNNAFDLVNKVHNAQISFWELSNREYGIFDVNEYTVTLTRCLLQAANFLQRNIS